jgi:hypothetical protein
MEHRLVRPWFCRQADALTDLCIATAALSGPNRFFEDYGVWKDAPVLIGTTKYEPLPDVKNIMITGGAGFM